MAGSHSWGKGQDFTLLYSDLGSQEELDLGLI